MKWEIELNQTGIGTVKCDGVDIASDLVGCHMTATPGKGVTLFLELRTGATFTLDDPTVQYAHQEQLDVHPLDQPMSASEEAEFNVASDKIVGFRSHDASTCITPDCEYHADQNRT